MLPGMPDASELDPAQAVFESGEVLPPGRNSHLGDIDSSTSSWFGSSTELPSLPYPLSYLTPYQAHKAQNPSAFMQEPLQVHDRVIAGFVRMFNAIKVSGWVHP